MAEPWRPGRGWVSVALLREAIRRLHRAYTALPRTAVLRWWRSMGIGTTALVVLTLATIALFRRLDASGAFAWEDAAATWLVEATPVSFSTAIWLDAAGNGFVLWLGVLACAGLAAWTGFALRALTLLVGFTLAYVPFVAGWTLWPRVRPERVAEGIASPGGLHAFPSGHTIQAMVAFGVLAHLWAKSTTRMGERILAWAIALAGVVVVSFARLRLGAHWPTDVIAAWLLGGAWLAMLIVALERGERAAAAALPSPRPSPPQTPRGRG